MTHLLPNHLHFTTIEQETNVRQIALKLYITKAQTSMKQSHIHITSSFRLSLVSACGFQEFGGNILAVL